MKIVKSNMLLALGIAMASCISLQNPAYGDTYEKVWDSRSTISNPIEDVAVGDTDGDGKLEIIVSDYATSGGAKIYIFENTGDNLYQKIWDSGNKLTMPFCYFEIGDQD